MLSPEVEGSSPRAGGPARADRLRRLADARLYLCTPRRAEFDAFLSAVVGTPEAPGVDLIQLREKGLEWDEELGGLRRVQAAAGARGVLVSANDRADLAAFAGVDILHVGQGDIPPRFARRLVGPDVLIGQSTHDPDQFLAALADPDVDYVCVGPVHATPTKEGRPPVGLGLPRLAARHAPPFAPGVKPWFVTGGVGPDTLDQILATGARRVVVVRGLTGVEDPAASAVALAQRLRAV
ncbi:thiamine-phosphate diphosphorylase [Frankia casuarinae]|uniref:Thiamine-phosphate synthase n=1 Tax=Frankia casuarinae (strain DSM 45818 / CECT 9043 / HFP020203 / CcI3) TaxID=106370 RepID=Q2J8G5_FRACC|nr:thiamine phosphate synthase [Frankia casuarinae]ABD12427.1 thiamine-phosphate diphosphorylase [Frankia casuarinae]EYT91995.1 thiamine-phosphate diphosphorylase [Frankia casuarinae]